MNRLRKPPTGFTMVPNALIRSANLSLKAKGLYCLLFSKPDNWIYMEDALIKESADGREAYRSGIKELVDAGWLNKVQVRDDKGVFSHIDWHLSVDGKPVNGEPVAGETGDGQSPPNNTDNNNTDESKTDTPKAPKGAELVNGAFEDFWSIYPNKVGKPAALKAFIRARADQSALLLGLDRWRHSESWQKDRGRFVPHPTTFLNQRRWEDMPNSAAPPKTDLDRHNEEFMKSFLAEGQTEQKQLA